MRGRLRALSVAFALAALVGCGATPPIDTGSDPVPPPPPDPPPSIEYFVYVVQRKDSLFGLQRRFNVPWQQIADLNKVEPESLAVGSILFIPRVEGVEPPQFWTSPAPDAGGSAERRPVDAQALHRGRPSAPYWWPTQGRLIRRYGTDLRGLPEPGIAISAPAGTEVCAAAAGTATNVVPASSSDTWGNVVIIAHAGGLVTWYAHLDGILVHPGQKVTKGQALGTVGCTGAADRPQLAFRMFRNARPIDPLKHLP